MTKIEILREEFKNITCILIFEMPAINIDTGEKDFIAWEIEEHRSGKGLTARADIDLDEDYVLVRYDESFTLDEHLAKLYEKCHTSISEDSSWEHRVERTAHGY